eukprot:614432-Hanusia_phi.AAC.1
MMLGSGLSEVEESVVDMAAGPDQTRLSSSKAAIRPSLWSFCSCHAKVPPYPSTGKQKLSSHVLKGSIGAQRTLLFGFSSLTPPYPTLPYPTLPYPTVANHPPYPAHQTPKGSAKSEI